MMTNAMFYCMAATIIFFILCSIKGTDGAPLLRHKRSTEVDTLTYKACEANEGFCNGHGMCYQSINATKKKICR